MKRETRFDKVFFSLIVLFILIRLASFWHMHAEDTQAWFMLAFTGISALTVVPHPPLTVLWFLLGGVFGKIWVLHLIPLVFQVLAAMLTYLLVLEWHSKKAARIALGLLAVCIWFITPGTQIDTDGSILLFFILLATYLYERSWKTRDWKTYTMLAFAIAATALVKFPGVLIGLVFVISDIFRMRTSWKGWQARVITYVGSGLIFILSLVLVKVFFPAYFTAMFGHGGNFVGNPLNQNYLNVFSIFAQAVILISPLLWALLWISFKEKKNNGNILCWTFIIVWFLFHLFVLNASFRPLERYLLPAIFAFVALGSGALARMKWEPTNIKWLGIGTGIITALLFIIEYFTTTIYPIYPKSAYFTRILTLDWSFLFPFRGSSGPFGFYVSFLTIGICFLSVFVLLTLWSFSKKKTAMSILIVILSIGLAYNIVMAEEFLFSGVHPNINKAGRGIIQYAVEHDLPPPLYAWNWLGHAELGLENLKHLGFSFHDDPILNAEIRASGGSILFLDYGKLGEDTELWQAIHECERVYTAEDKGVYLGGVFDCSK